MFRALQVTLPLIAICCATSSLAAEATAAKSILRIQDYLVNGNAAAAEDLLKRSLQRWPGDGGLYNLRGILHASAQDFAAAQADFEQAVKLSPALAPAWKNLARIYERDSDAKAEVAYRTVVRLSPGDTEAASALARLLEWRGAFAESLRQLDRLPADARSTAAALALRTGDFAGLGRAAEAASTSKELLSAGGLQEADILTVLPVIEKKQPQLALRLVQGLEERHLATDTAREHLGAIYENLGELPQAREAYEGSAHAGELKASALLDLARIAYKQHQIDDALGYVAHARELEPNNAAVHFFFGMLAVEKDLPLEARKSLETAVRLAPDQPYYNYALGAVASQGHAPSEAIRYFQKYVQLTAGEPRGRFALGMAYFTAGDYEHARAELNAVAEAPETLAGANYFLGRIDKVEGDLAHAAAHFERAIAANAGFADAHAELGLVHIRQSNLDRAAAELEAALRLDANNPAANRNLLMLYQRSKDPRTEAQAARVKEIEAKREEKENLMFRTIEVRPF